MLWAEMQERGAQPYVNTHSATRNAGGKSTGLAVGFVIVFEMLELGVKPSMIAYVSYNLSL